MYFQINFKITEIKNNIINILFKTLYYHQKIVKILFKHNK